MYNLTNQVLMQLDLQNKLNIVHDEELRFMEQAIHEFHEQINQHHMKQEKLVAEGTLEKTTFNSKEKEEFDNHFKETEEWIANLRKKIKLSNNE